MTAEYARTEWDRALEAFRAATLLLAHGGFDSAASRAYYAVFHAANALFAIEGRTFTKHSALEAAVHRDLVKAGRSGFESLPPSQLKFFLCNHLHLSARDDRRVYWAT